MFWEKEKVEVVPANMNSFLIDTTIVESILYSPCVGPIVLIDDYKEEFMESCNLTNQRFKWKT